MLQLSNDSWTCSPVAEVWAQRRLKWSQTDIVHGMGERAHSKTLRNELQNMVMSSLGTCCGRYNCSSSDQGMSLLIAVPCRQQGIAPNTVTSVSAILRLLHIDTRQHLTTWKMHILKYKQQKENETKSRPINLNLPFLFFPRRCRINMSEFCMLLDNFDYHYCHFVWRHIHQCDLETFLLLPRCHFIENVPPQKDHKSTPTSRSCT